MFILKTIISLAPIAAGLHWYSQSAYSLGLHAVLSWWGANLKQGEYKGVIFMGLLFGFLPLLMFFYGLLQVTYLTAVGEKKEMVYLGHVGEVKAMFREPYGFSSLPVEMHYGGERNFSLDAVNRLTHFFVDPFNKVGMLQEKFGGHQKYAFSPYDYHIARLPVAGSLPPASAPRIP